MRIILDDNEAYRSEFLDYVKNLLTSFLKTFPAWYGQTFST